MKRVLLSVMACVLVAGVATAKPKAKPFEPVRLIFDTDIGPDFDDVGAMAVMHALADRGEVEILATLSCNRDPLTVPVIEIINRHYARPDIPVGIVREGGVSMDDHWHEVKWPVVLNEKYGKDLRYPTSAAAPAAVRVYREVLAKAADKSVTVCSVGFFTNLADLLASAGDDLSPLSGRELVAQKVVRLVSMAGRVRPGGGREFNVHKDAPSAAKVFAEWPTPITISPFELGEQVKTGVLVKDLPDDGNPIRDAFATALAEKDKDGRMSWDETAVYEAIRARENRLFKTERGEMQVDPVSGSNTWTSAASGKVTTLVLKQKPTDVSFALEDLMCACPKGRWETDALKPFAISRPVPARLSDGRRGFQACPSIAVSKGGRLWVAVMTGGRTEDEENADVVFSSGDGGKTWSKPLFSIDCEGPLRILDPGFFTTPDGRVYHLYGQLYGMWDGRCGLWAVELLDPDREDTPFGKPFRLCDGYLKNKPLVTRDGRCLLPVEFFSGAKCWCGGLKRSTEMPAQFAHDSTPYLAANVFEWKDWNRGGTSATLLGQSAIAPKDRCFRENMIVERKDGSLWMLSRMKYGIGEATSTDGGKTWTETKPSKIANPNSRFFIGRLKSGRLLLVKNGPVVNDKPKRDRIMAYLSDDDGATWIGGLMLDARQGTSYPDAGEDEKGVLHVVNDWSRTGGREIIHHAFREEDVLAGRPVTADCRLGTIVNKAGPR